MIDPEQNKVSIKVYEATRDKLEDRKLQVRRNTGEKLDYADLVEAAVNQFIGAVPGQSVPPLPANAGLPADEEFVTFFQKLSRVLARINKKDWKWLEMLAAILASGNKKAHRAVTENLNVFHEYVELHASNGTAGSAVQPEAAGQQSATNRKDSETTRRTKGHPERGGSGVGKTGTDGG